MTKTANTHSIRKPGRTGAQDDNSDGQDWALHNQPLQEDRYSQHFVHSSSRTDEPIEQKAIAYFSHIAQLILDELLDVLVRVLEAKGNTRIFKPR